MIEIASNNMRVKQLNIERVKQVLLELGNATKLIIANATELSVATCGNILNEMLERGEVMEVDFVKSPGGRPARRFRYNPNYRYVACIYLSVHEDTYSVTSVVSNMSYEIIEENTKIIDVVRYEMVDGLIEKLLDTYDNLAAVGIGVPATVNDDVIEDDSDIETLANLPLGKKLREKYSINFVVENNVNLQAIGYYKKQKFENDKSISFINFPKDNCIGSGIIVDGRVLKGDSNFAGEVSFLPFGTSREEQIRQFSNREMFLPLSTKVIVSIIATINPHTIVITSDLVGEEIVEKIYGECVKVIPDVHMPEIVFRENVHDDYVNGLVSVALDSLSGDVRLVKKKL